MAKEAAEMSEETVHMIERSAGKDPEGALCPGDAKEMRAVVLTGFGGLNKLRVTRKAMPEPQEGEIKIRVKACGLNFLDLMVRQGNIDNPPKTPLVPGFECSGIVEALGSNTKGFEIGDRVMAFVNYNAWAEVVCTPLEFVYKIPDDMTFPEAAAFSMNFVAAYMMLFEVANLRDGMSVLVHSAGGGVVSQSFGGAGDTQAGAGEPLELLWVHLIGVYCDSCNSVFTVLPLAEAFFQSELQ
uniref:Vesicle amine transport 1-like n=1 Tax=Scleropages formosus TaxID=113540 RepID=A0A8C9SWF9_SCLFO